MSREDAPVKCLHTFDLLKAEPRTFRCRWCQVTIEPAQIPCSVPGWMGPPRGHDTEGK